VTTGSRTGGAGGGGSGSTPDSYTPYFFEFESGTAWTDLSDDQKQFALQADVSIANYQGEVLAVPPTGGGSEIEQAQAAISGTTWLYSKNTKIHPQYKIPVLAEGTANYNLSGNKKSIFIGNPSGRKVTFYGLGMSNFRKADIPNASMKKAGYFMTIRAGASGVSDLIGHEHSHTFNFSSSGKLFLNNPQKWQYDFERRADSYLKLIRDRGIIR